MTAVAPLPLFKRAMADSWRGLIGWSLGLLAALLLYVPLYPSIGGNPDMEALLDQLPKELISALGYDAIGSGPGYTQSTFFGLIGFLLLSIAAIGWGTSAIAGDEESGALELTLAHAVGRTRVVLERTAAIALRLLWLAALSVVVILALNEPAELDIEPGNLVATAAALVGVTLLSGAASVAAGSLTGRRVLALGAGTTVAVLGYALNAVANQSEDLDGLHAASPYAWAFGASPLMDGADWGGLGLLYGGCALLIVVAVLGLRRRDIGV